MRSIPRSVVVVGDFNFPGIDWSDGVLISDLFSNSCKVMLVKIISLIVGSNTETKALYMTTISDGIQSSESISQSMLCQTMFDAIEGQFVNQTITSLDRYHCPVNSSLMKYIWRISFLESMPREYDVYMFVRINILTFSFRQLDVYEITSQSILTKNVSLNSEADGFEVATMPVEPSKNSHILLVFSVDTEFVSTRQIQFLTNLYRYWPKSKDFKKEENVGWFLCRKVGWLIPVRHKCDGLSHCLSKEDENESLCSQENRGSLFFLRWLIPVVSGFLAVGIFIFAVKTYSKHKAHQQRGSECRNGNGSCSTDNENRRSLLPSPSAAQPQRVPSVIYITSNSNSTTEEELARSIQGRDIPRASIPVPVPMARSLPIAIPIVIRPQIHRDASAIPPSYEEATADHSLGESSDDLDDLEGLSEYHPPSYEDASQGRAELLVSSWISSSRQQQPTVLP